MNLRFATPALLFALTLASASLTLGDTATGPQPTLPSLGTPGADPTVIYAFTVGPGPSEQGFGQLTATEVGDNIWLATSGYFDGVSGPDQGIYNLVANPNVNLLPTPPTVGDSTSPLGAFFYDDLVYNTQNPSLDGAGLLFSSGGTEINIWGNSPGNYSFYGYSNAGGYSPTITDSGQFAAVVVDTPEPSGVLLLATMLLGVGISCRRAFGRV